MRILDVRRSPRVRLSLGSAAIFCCVAAVGLPRLQAQQPARSNVASKPSPAPPPVAPAPAPIAPKAISGVVRDAAGKPVEGVMITGTEARREIMFENGVLNDFVRHDWLYAESDAQGRYRFTDATLKRTDPPIKEYGIFAYDPHGYARRSAEELARSSDLTLEPWGRVEGTVTVLGKPLANVPLRFMLDATDEHSMFYDVYEYETRTDAQGRFIVEHVPAGVAHVATGTRFGKNPGPYGVLSSRWAIIKAGETLTLSIGGVGRPVIGKIWVLEGPPVNLGGGRLVLKTSLDSPESAPSRLGEQATKGWDPDRLFRHNFDLYRSPVARARRLAARYHEVRIAADGGFRAEEVPAGTYRLEFWSGEDYQHPIAAREVVVPPMTDGSTDEPLDIGRVTIRPASDKKKIHK